MKAKVLLISMIVSFISMLQMVNAQFEKGNWIFEGNVGDVSISNNQTETIINVSST
jgi:hypothetical protein